ncbi:MAG: spore protease YyaC [Clostridiaceae bacterium]|nr:spore protease YyaC [Clostridiaceae bacterium]
MCLNGKGYFKSDDKFASLKVARAVSSIIGTAGLKCGVSSQKRPIVVMCIGTDRSTGDSLGPLVGDMLSKWKMTDVHIFGTLDFPVHARNLEETLKRTYEIYHKPYIIAVDASLGIMEHVGCITVGKGPIKPGAGLKKELPAVGDMHITGVVNTGGFMDFLVLQSTRLSVVMKMADIIARGLHIAFNEYADTSYSNSFYTAQYN